jgi:tRNA G10  N-methylase Trm11
LVLDPYMGGGTTLVEALIAGRNVVGNDLNSLAASAITPNTSASAATA